MDIEKGLRASIERSIKTQDGERAIQFTQAYKQWITAEAIRVDQERKEPPKIVGKLPKVDPLSFSTTSILPDNS